MVPSMVFLLSSLVSVSPVLPVSAVRESCGAPRWKSDPQVVSNVFRGTVTMRCDLTTAGEGDYRKLFDTYVKGTETEGTVHSGPVETTYENLPAVKFDLTLDVNEDGLQSVRTDTYLAGDDGHFVAAALSTQISATGLAANVIKMDNVLRVSRGTRQRTHGIQIEATTHVRKPLIVGVNQFKRIVMDRAEKAIREKGPSTARFVSESL